MTRNRVQYWASQRGYNSPLELYKALLKADVEIGKSTVESLYRNPEYMASVKSLEVLARFFSIKVTELIEDDDSSSGDITGDQS